TVTGIPAPVRIRANSATWSVSLYGDVKVIIRVPPWEIAQNWGRAADTWNPTRPTRDSAGSGKLTRPRFDTATVRLRLLSRLSQPSTRSLIGRGTTRSTGDFSTLIRRRSFFSNAFGVAFGRNCASRWRHTDPRSSAPLPYVWETLTVAKKLRAEVDGKNCRRFTGTDAAKVRALPRSPAERRMDSKNTP